MAEAFLRRRLAERGVDAHIHSAGLRIEGEPASAHGVSVLADRGLDISAHRSRVVERILIERADLVIAMAREHLIEAVVVAPDAWSRIFIFKELVGRAEAMGPRPARQPFSAWLARVNAGRQRADLMTLSGDDDIDDPIGLGRKDYERTADEISDLVDRLVNLGWPDAAEASA